MRLTPRVFGFVGLVLGLAGAGAAQQAGYRDLTISWRAPEDHIPTPSSALCPSVRSTVSDEDPRQSPAAPGKPGDKLEFTVRQIVPSELHIGDDFTATVRLQNVGVTQVPIPWQTDGEQVVRVSKDGKQEIYEVADVAFRLKTGDKKRAPMFLQSEGALFAHPDDHANYLALAPGRWVDIKLKGAVVCGLSDCLIEAEADDHAVLTAWWYQRVLTHHVEGCHEDHGAYTVRELDSSPYPLAIHGPATLSQSKIPN
jgi:hypothetical protein